MSFGSIHLAVHVIAPKIVYYELFWILHLILSKYMRSKSENVIRFTSHAGNRHRGILCVLSN